MSASQAERRGFDPLRPLQIAPAPLSGAGFRIGNSHRGATTPHATDREARPRMRGRGVESLVGVSRNRRVPLLRRRWGGGLHHGGRRRRGRLNCGCGLRRRCGRGHRLGFGRRGGLWLRGGRRFGCRHRRRAGLGNDGRGRRCHGFRGCSRRRYGFRNRDGGRCRNRGWFFGPGPDLQEVVEPTPTGQQGDQAGEQEQRSLAGGGWLRSIGRLSRHIHRSGGYRFRSAGFNCGNRKRRGTGRHRHPTLV